MLAMEVFILPYVLHILYPQGEKEIGQRISPIGGMFNMILQQCQIVSCAHRISLIFLLFRESLESLSNVIIYPSKRSNS